MVQDSEWVIDGRKLDDATTYTCVTGMRTDDGSQTKTITCSIDETWSETQITCGREYVPCSKPDVCRFYILGLRPNGRHFTNDILKYILF